MSLQQNSDNMVVNDPPATTDERFRTWLAAGSFFLLLSGYYILRPVRDEMAVRTGSDRLPWLFTGTFVCTLAFVPLFGWIVQRCPRAVLIPLMYGLMIGCLVTFYALFLAGVSSYSAAAFFIWLSLFNQMVVSLFWSSVSDAFTTEQAQRRYGYITAGGTSGAILGPAITAAIAERVGTANLLLVAMGLLIGAILGLIALRQQATGPATTSQRPIGGSVLAGITQTFRNPLLASLAGLVMCYSAISTVLYLQMTHIVGKTYADPGSRTAFFARVDLSVNLLALAIQLLATQQIIRHWGLRGALSLIPTAMILGLIAVGLWPAAVAFAVVQCIHRAGEFSLSKPSREILFTTVDQESRYKAKNFIDTVIYRTNDTASSWLITTIQTIGGSAIWCFALPIAFVWFALCQFVGASFGVASGEMKNETTTG